MTALSCPSCGRQLVRRSKRNGLIEKVVSLAYIYPFRCEECSHRFWALQLGMRYVKVVRDRRRSA